MDFDRLVSRMETELLPKLEQRAKLLCADPHYSEVRVASLRHAEILHAIGIACVPIWSNDRSEYLSLCAKFSKLEVLRVRIDVSWGQSFRSGTSQGYVKKEDRGRVRRIETESDVEALLEDWLALETRFDKLAVRGRPSARIMRTFRGAPRDLSQVPQTANHSPEPTPGAVH